MEDFQLIEQNHLKESTYHTKNKVCLNCDDTKYCSKCAIKPEMICYNCKVEKKFEDLLRSNKSKENIFY